MKNTLILTLAVMVLSIATPVAEAGPFSDLPKGHWAYSAVQQAVDAGILQGYDGRFHGSKSLNRYQMAVVVSRMLDSISTMGPGKVSRRDVENLEALTIEFADELALLNVKVSTLEDSFAELRHDVDGLKADFASGGARAGISGLVQTRLVITDDDPNHIQNRGGAAFAAAGSGTPFAATAGVAGTLPVARYVANVPTGPSATTAGERRTFFNVAQTSLAFDRHVDEDVYVHMQLDIDADQEAAFINGNQIQVNEAYIDLESWLADGDVRVRLGSWALPFQRERNPEMVEYPNQLRYGFRTLDLTISPAFWDANWESVRNVGAGLWNGKDSDLKWNIGVTNISSGAFNRDGSLLAWRQASAAGVPMGNPFGTNGGPPAGNPGRTLAVNATQNLSGGGWNLYGDALESIDSNGPGDDAIGFYGWVGDKYDGGFRWDAGYFENGGVLNPGTDESGSASEWNGFQFNAGYWGWENWGFMGSYYDATSSSRTVGGTAGGGARTAIGGARNFVGLGLYPALTGTTAAYPDVDSRAYSFLVNYKFNDDNNISVRYEDIEDSMGAAAINANVWTLDWNHRISENSLLQIEWTTPESESVTVAPGAAIGTVGAATRNSSDVNDDLIQINYKVRF